MSAYINRKQSNSAGVGAKPWVQLNRWDNNANYSLVLKFTGTATVTVEGTLDHINRELETIEAFDVENAIDLTADAYLNITNTPLEAIRINQTAGAGSVDFHVMQGGS